MRYKRNQIEEAIARLVDRGSAKPNAQTRNRLKRLLDTDRGSGRSKRSADPERANFAFFSMDSPGRGVEIWFSEYEAFALLTGLRLMQHGWPQGFAVAVLRRVRPELEEHHAGILSQDPAKLFDQEAIRARAKGGDMAVGNINPIFLVIRRQEDGSGPIFSSLCRGPEELMPLIRSDVGIASTIFELANSAHALASELSQTRASKRGRGSA
jgi:hypothetical protein